MAMVATVCTVANDYLICGADVYNFLGIPPPASLPFKMFLDKPVTVFATVCPKSAPSPLPFPLPCLSFLRI